MNILDRKMAGFVLFGAALCLGACSKMNDTYKQFLEGGMKTYIGKVDSVFVYPGRNRVQLAWLVPSDPKIKGARIYWNNRQDALEVPFDGANQADTMRTMLDDFAEGPYVFEVFTFDGEGNTSLKTEVLARVYGDNYNSSLLSRPIDSYQMQGDTLMLTWGASPDPTAIGSELTYRDENGTQQTLVVSADEVITYIMRFTPQTITHRTFYLPAPLAIDTFYTTEASLRVKGEPMELPKAGWIATASSYDIAGNRPASNAIDGNEATIWVNQTRNPAYVYPHTIEVDMGEVHDELEGFAIVTRVGDAAARPRTIQLFTSVDGEEWASYGTMILENTGDRQFIALTEPVSARYFKMTAHDAHNNGNNIALAEIGMYYR